MFLLSLVAPFAMHLVKVPGLLFSLLDIAVIVISTAVIAYNFGMEADERRLLSDKVKTFAAKLRRQ